jgi:hypothetical protein
MYNTIDYIASIIWQQNFPFYMQVVSTHAYDVNIGMIYISHHSIIITSIHEKTQQNN